MKIHHIPKLDRYKHSSGTSSSNSETVRSIKQTGWCDELAGVRLVALRPWNRVGLTLSLG